jgi:hypothetical protein
MVFRTFRFYVTFLFLVLTTAIPAECEESVNQEIAHLLQYIESSACIFIRNGEEHSAAEARGHIQKKYDHFKNRVKTTEDFIKYTAAKSSMSGEPYMVRCSGLEIRNADWLNAELQKLRNRS